MAPKHAITGAHTHYRARSTPAPEHTTDGPQRSEYSFGARNIQIRKDSGMAVLLDFEHAAIGDPHWDLGKIWDQELADPDLRKEFVGAYRQRARLCDWPDPRVLWVTRFAAAMGIFPYAARVDDADFFGHGVEKLVTLRGELPVLLR